MALGRPPEPPCSISLRVPPDLVIDLLNGGGEALEAIREGLIHITSNFLPVQAVLEETPRVAHEALKGLDTQVARSLLQGLEQWDPILPVEAHIVPDDNVINPLWVIYLARWYQQVMQAIQEDEEAGSIIGP
ncbi:unnamed protein product [Pleuronectes platessa]|uniref:Uncharacterized protein n=1 Tax=Pleuronectes platessa TaxID=8262 RepID=A0A9N7V2E0_PLEPL|nr:unnamed protein product [Pleuronectes platessa]